MLSPGWKVELLAAGGSLQVGFTGRLEYLDKLKVRGILAPERTVLEGQHGTLAEAEAHADVALTQADLTHQYVVDQLNLQVVDRLLVLNYGEDTRGAVQVVPAPIVDAKRSFYRDLYKTLLANPNFQTHELSALDLDALKDTLGLPKSTEIDHTGKQPTSPGLQNSSAIACDGSDDDKGHWVTINGHPVFIKGRAPKGVDSKTVPDHPTRSPSTLKQERDSVLAQRMATDREDGQRAVAQGDANLNRNRGDDTMKAAEPGGPDLPEEDAPFPPSLHPARTPEEEAKYYWKDLIGSLTTQLEMATAQRNRVSTRVTHERDVEQPDLRRKQTQLEKRYGEEDAKFLPEYQDLTQRLRESRQIVEAAKESFNKMDARVKRLEVELEAAKQHKEPPPVPQPPVPPHLQV